MSILEDLESPRYLDTSRFRNQKILILRALREEGDVGDHAGGLICIIDIHRYPAVGN